ncbi:MAG: ABC transporter permease [Armatimonadetes bacterium]|nr:ABC transporter permease [Armatimonadota bacterium]
MEFLQFWTRETFANIRRNRLMSLLAISTVTVALFILGAFYLTISNLRAAVTGQAQKLDLVVILDRNIKPARRDAIVDGARIPQVAKVELVSAAQALGEFKKSYPDLPLEDFVNDNPLGDELRVRLKNPEDFFKVRTYLASVEGVSAVKDAGADFAAQRLLDFNRFLTTAAIISLIVLGLAILLIIHNAIRLTVYARRREIRIMQLVGATSSFIRVPFLLEGLFYGVSGALLASVGLGVLYRTASGNPAPLVKWILPLAPGEILGSCVVLMVIAGLIFGVLGAYISFTHSQRGASA